MNLNRIVLSSVFCSFSFVLSACGSVSNNTISETHGNNNESGSGSSSGVVTQNTVTGQETASKELVSLDIPELNITLRFSQSVAPYLDYMPISGDMQAVNIVLKNYRDKIPESEIPSWKDQQNIYIQSGHNRAKEYDEKKHQEAIESAKTCVMGVLSVIDLGKDSFGSTVVAKSKTKQVVYTPPQEPCSAYFLSEMVYKKHIDSIVGVVSDYFSMLSSNPSVSPSCQKEGCIIIHE